MKDSIEEKNTNKEKEVTTEAFNNDEFKIIIKQKRVTNRKVHYNVSDYVRTHSNMCDTLQEEFDDE